MDWRVNGDRYERLIGNALEAAAGDVSDWAKAYWGNVAARLMRDFSLEMETRTIDGTSLGRARPDRIPSANRSAPARKRSQPRPARAQVLPR